MRLEDSDWQRKTEGESGMFTWRSLNIGPLWGRFSVEFYEKLSLFGPEYRMWREAGFSCLDSDFQAFSGRTRAAEESSFKKKSPGSASVRRQVSDL